MKTFRLFLLTCLLLLSATAIAAAETPEISADRQSVDPTTLRYLLSGHVTVRFKERTITADEAQVDLKSLEVWAQNHIRLVQDDILFTGDTLYVAGKKNTAQVTGNANFQRGALTILADQAEFNWKTKIAEFSGHVRLTQDGDTQYFSQVLYDVITGEIMAIS